MLLGLLCGYPMGARISSELYANHSISKNECQYLLSFSCNASPAFLLNYLAWGCLDGQIPAKLIFLPLLLADLLCMLVFRILLRPGRYRNEKSPLDTRAKKETPSILSPGEILDISIMNGLETITRLGGYLLLFSILNAALSHFWVFSRKTLYLFSGVMELTTGLHSLSQSTLSLEQKYLFSMVMVSFGGICVLSQTRSCLDPSLSMRTYLIAKLLNTGLTLLFSLYFLKFIL